MYTSQIIQMSQVFSRQMEICEISVIRVPKLYESNIHHRLSITPDFKRHMEIREISEIRVIRIPKIMQNQI